MKTIIKVDGMHCEGCEKRIKNVLSNIDNIKDVVANHETKEVVITSKNKIDLDEIKETLSDLGFEVKEEN